VTNVTIAICASAQGSMSSTRHPITLDTPLNLAIRPLFHQLEKRVKAHVLVAFLGYALQVTLKHLLKRSGSEYSPAQALKRLAEIRSVDIVLPMIEGREIWLRRIARLDEEQQRILHQLNFNCRNVWSRFRFKNVVPTRP